jgi:pantothenate kinase
VTDVADLAARATALLREDRRVLIGITGPPGAGKSTLIEALLGQLGELAAHVPMDGFHLADKQLDRLGLRGRKGAPETFDARGYAATLRRVVDEPGSTIYVPGFARDLEQPIAAAGVVQARSRLVLTEGNYLLLADGDWPAVRALLDEVWYVDVPEDERIRRLVARHVESGKAEAAADRWAREVDGPNARLVEATRGTADLVLSW